MKKNKAWPSINKNTHALVQNLIENADHALLPIEGSNGFNHLPVRGAISIILDRLLGNRELPVD